MNNDVPDLWLYRHVKDYRACKTVRELWQLADQDLFDWFPELGEEWAACHDRLTTRELLVGGAK